MKKAVLLFSKKVDFVKDGLARSIYVGTCQDVAGGGIFEIVSSGAFSGTAIFYKDVAAGEELYPGRVADVDTKAYLGSTTLASVKEIKATSVALAEMDF